MIVTYYFLSKFIPITIASKSWLVSAVIFLDSTSCNKYHTLGIHFRLCAYQINQSMYTLNLFVKVYVWFHWMISICFSRGFYERLYRHFSMIQSVISSSRVSSRQCLIQNPISWSICLLEVLDFQTYRAKLMTCHNINWDLVFFCYYSERSRVLIYKCFTC